MPDRLSSIMSCNATGESLMLMTQQYVLNRVPLNRSTLKTNLRIDCLMKMLRPEVGRTQVCISPKNNGSVLANSMFLFTL